MSADYYKTLIKDIIENNEKEKAIEIIANKLNEKQISNEKEMLTNLDKDKEIERLNNIIKEVREYVKQLIDLKEEDYLKSVSLIYIEKILEILDKAGDEK